MKRALSFFVLILLPVLGLAQETSHLNGLSNKKSIPYLIKGATVHVDPEKTIDNGEVLIRDGKIIDVGKNIATPEGTIIINAIGRHLYSAFIDASSDFGMPKIKAAKAIDWYQNVFESAKKGAFSTNEAIKSENKAAEHFLFDTKRAETLRALGFGAAWVHVPDGISRGTGAAVALGLGGEHETLIEPELGRFYSFDRGSSAMSYPISIMGKVALLRQTYLDTDWYEKGGKALERNLSLEAFQRTKTLKPVFYAKSVDDILRASDVGHEFGEQYLFKGNGDEYQRIEEIRNTKAQLIIPIDFPKAEKIDDLLEGNALDIGRLRHWNLAASNPAILHQAGVRFAISAGAAGQSFFDNIRKAMLRGLPENVALAALTTIPAEFMGMQKVLGKIDKHFVANLILTDKPIFEKDAMRISVWVQGNEFKLEEPEGVLASTFKLHITDDTTKYTIKVKRKKGKNEFSLYKADSLKQKADFALRNESLAITTTLKDTSGLSSLIGFRWPDGSFHGHGFYPTGEQFEWHTKPINDSVKTEIDSSKVSDEIIARRTHPFAAFGFTELPKSQNFLLKNATVWTNEEQGILNEADVLVKGGKIAAIGKGLKTDGLVTEIDAKGKHITAGIIDEHSHIALYSINELETVSSQVRQRDALNPSDVNIYRQLAGGVTTSQLLHGSADCVGGQSAIIKLKWGESADGLLIPQAPRFIKFALGENVKRGNAPSNRYPITRMGVEQVYIDAFTRAKEYKKEWAAYQKEKTAIPPRRDLKLEALADILDDKLHITCHSYVQSEINMLMHLADSLGFKINTFTHILEGYKVADKMKARGIYGSTFSDWWAYKVEVREAIPYNAAIMNKVGVKTAINSDDAEMARRLNQEAAKAVLYGGLTEEEAWKTVTLYPAMMLHLDDRIGSIKVGKDADLVIWNNNPLSIYAKPEKTMIEGKVYFDEEQHDKLRHDMQKEKTRLIQAMQNDKGEKRTTPQAKALHKIHCDSILEYGGISIDNWQQEFSNK